MKAKTLLMLVCSALIMWSCEQDSSLSTLDRDISNLKNEKVINGASITMYEESSTGIDIPYRVSFDKLTGTTLYYLPSDIYAFLSGSVGSATDSIGGRDENGTSMPYYHPVHSGLGNYSHLDLNYILDIYITEDNKIIYPPVYLPYISNSDISFFYDPNSEVGKGEQYFDRNQYSGIFKNTEKPIFTLLENNNKMEYPQGTDEQNSVFYIIKNNLAYFHIDPSSDIFTNNKSEVNMGKFHMPTYTATWTRPVNSTISEVVPVVKYDIDITLKLIKGNPPTDSIADDNIIRPVDRLYNISVFDQKIYVSSLKDKMISFIDDNNTYYPRSAYFKNADESISILNSTGKQIAKYPSYYKLDLSGLIDDECEVMKTNGIPAKH